MKNITFLIALFVANFSFGQLNIIENFDYADGTSLASTSNWTRISGTENQITVNSGSIVVSDSKSEDVAIEISTIEAVVYFSFDFSVADPGSYSGTDFEYFAHVKDGSFKAKVDIAEFSATGFKPGIANSSSTAETIWPTELSYGTTYRAVILYNGSSTLWINPVDVNSTSISGTSDNGGKSANVTSVNFRQSAATPNTDITIDNVTVTDTFNNTTLSSESMSSIFSIVVKASNGSVTANRGEILAVYNTLGQKVANANLQGVYIVRVQDGAQVKAVKVLVQ